MEPTVLADIPAWQSIPATTMRFVFPDRPRSKIQFELSSSNLAFWQAGVHLGIDPDAAQMRTSKSISVPFPDDSPAVQFDVEKGRVYVRFKGKSDGKQFVRQKNVPSLKQFEGDEQAWGRFVKPVADTLQAQYQQAVEEDERAVAEQADAQQAQG